MPDIIEAVRLSVKALNEAPKYKEALHLAVKDTTEYTDVWCDDHCQSKKNAPPDCVKCGVEHYEREAGLKVVSKK